jgi:DNA replication ATP-dependent helicase Dna2
MIHARDFLIDLETRIREEARHGWDGARVKWNRPLEERKAACRAIGFLEVTCCEREKGGWLVHFEPLDDDQSFFREGDLVRLSRNDPDGSDWISAEFFGLTEKGLTVRVDRHLDPSAGWTLDEGHLDLSDFYLRALEELAKSDHGRETVLPVLCGADEPDSDLAAYDDAAEALAERELDASQADAVARCLAAETYHLVQGPPGTGKTHALAELVRQLVAQGQRVLVCAFTHRAIHHALRKISPLVDCPVFKVSEPMHQDGEDIDFRHDFAATGLLDHPGPYVVGITPIPLFTSRAGEARFDVAVIDETSQMRVEAAIMPMLRARRFFFFGDHRQLPPVVQRPVDDPAEDSVFASLAKGRSRTMLKTTYRLNRPLTLWPSENFYGGELVSAESVADHGFAMKSGGTGLLDTEPSLVRVELPHEGNRSSSPEEADETAALIERMLRGGVPAAEIGVVVPFRAQAARVRKLLRFDRFSVFPGARRIAVDTVERFQGQEREVMILSFAVSDMDFMNRLGSFLVMPQRLNVAVTRARTKVVLVHSAAFRHWLERGAEHDERMKLAFSLIESAGR